MGQLRRTNEDSYPKKFSLLPDEKKAILAKLPERGETVTDLTLKNLAKRNHVAVNAIHKIAEQNGNRVITAKPRTERPKTQTARERAEAAFKKLPDTPPEQVAEPEPPQPTVEDIDALAELEQQLTKKYQTEIDRLLADVAKMESELKAERETVEKERETARVAMEQVAFLRRTTKQERDELESLRGEGPSIRRRMAQATADRDWAMAEMGRLMKTTRALTAALRKSEEDLMECRASKVRR